MRHYYNDHDAFAAQWLRNLIAAGHLPPGDVDERSITDVTPGDLRGYTQCHFFAGLGGWPLAIRWAGLEYSAGIWTGSCPCQPLSCAGLRKGHADERHLWPAFYELIAECAPSVVLGEQVASADGREWLAGIRADLEDLGYACGAADLCAAGVGSPQIRQRLFWVADTADGRFGLQCDESPGGRELGGRCDAGGLADTSSERLEGRRDGQARLKAQGVRLLPARPSEPRGLEHAQGDGWQPRGAEPIGGSTASRRELDPWADSRAIICLDGAWRRIAAEPEIFPLAARLPGDVGRLRGAGNAIVPQVALEFIEAWLEAR